MGHNCEIMTIFAIVLWQKPDYRWWRILHQKNRPYFHCSATYCQLQVTHSTAFWGFNHIIKFL